jgi:hypothetical protein
MIPCRQEKKREALLYKKDVHALLIPNTLIIRQLRRK